MPDIGRLPDMMAPCGVYCGACPSFGMTCSSADPALQAYRASAIVEHARHLG
jgi:hypothetical protein